MTRKSSSAAKTAPAASSARPRARRAVPLPGHWSLQDAKARFSELVRSANSQGPQHVTVRGRDEVVVMSASEYRRLTGVRTGRALVEAMQKCPVSPEEWERIMHREPYLAPVRDVDL
jgi:prevent-host-death family protein